MRECLNIDCEFSELTDSAINDVEIIQECYAALDEGVTDDMIIDTAQKYTKSLLVTVLEFAHNLLTKMVAQLLKYFNAYIINDVRIANKYKAFIVAMAGKLDEPIHYDYYSYEGLYEYPQEITVSSFQAGTIIAKMDQIIKTEKKPGSKTLREYVDEQIIDFGKAVLGQTIKPDDLNYSVQKAIDRKVRGRKTVITINSKNIEDFYKDMEATVKERKKVNAIKAQINRYYSMLKAEIDKAYKGEKPPRNPGNPNFRDADVNIHKITGNVTKFELERNRLLNAYIQIYRVAFKEKIDILNEKIRLDAGLIGELCKRASVFASVLPPERKKA